MKAATRHNVLYAANPTISIHAAREGGDAVAGQVPADYTLFQSTPPVKAATLCESVNLFLGRISIHAAREGGDV